MIVFTDRGGIILGVGVLAALFALYSLRFVGWLLGVTVPRQEEFCFAVYWGVAMMIFAAYSMWYDKRKQESEKKDKR